MTDGTASRIEAAARLIVSTRLSPDLLEPLPEALRPTSDADGYAVQRLARATLESSGFGRQAGWKIGCTTPVMQAYLGIDSPCAGAMFLANVWQQDHTFSVPTSGRLGVECEIAVRIGRDLRARDRPYQADDVAGAVAASMAAIEVVEDRYLDYQALGTPTLIADDFFHHGCVLGSQHESFDAGSLREVRASMAIDGVEVGSGVGSDILGDPLEVLSWLANSCVSWGSPLLAGDVVLLGSLVQTNWVAAGSTVEVLNESLGPVRATFAPPTR
jgi:2-keto-4-pentenoate hydratase